MHLTAITRSASCTNGLTQIIRVMKMTAILLLTAVLQVSARSDAQTVTLKVKDAPLKEVFREIQRQTRLNILVNENALAKTGKVTLEVNDMPVAQVLSLCLRNEKLSFTIVDGTIVISPAPTVLQPADNYEKPLPPPPITVRGRITDENGEPVIATVTVKGTNNAVSTNSNGEFEINNVDENATLVITGVSIEREEVKVHGRANFLITAKTRISEGEEVMIKGGYYDVKKKEATGNISRVSAKELEKNSVSNPIAALAGRVPGLEITQRTGVPGGNFRVRIRGTNSIANGNDPLYIIDGVPYISTTMSFNNTSNTIYGNSNPVAGQGTNPLNSINILDIESIEVLKDADATAIYGSRGANGIILITTKRGKPGKLKVHLNYYTGSGKVSRKIDLLDRRSYLDMRYEAFKNDGITPDISNASDLLLWDTLRSTDWQKELIGGTANYQDAQLSVSGGEKNIRYSIGGGFHRETTVYPGDNSDRRISFHSNIANTSANEKFKSSITLNYSSGYTDLLNQDLTDRALTLPPIAPALYAANGDLSWINWNYNYENPLAFLKRKYEAYTNNLIGSAVISYALLNNLDIKANLGYANTSVRASTISPLSSKDPVIIPFSSNFTNFSNSSFQNWIVEPQINWRPQLAKGSFDVLVGTTFLNQETEGLAQSADGFASEALMRNIAAATNRTIGENYYRQYRYNALFGRINYTLNNRYIINLTGRRDGSSRFGPGKQFANFGAIGAGWIFSRESWIQKTLPFLSFGKIRASYGTNGNDQIGDYQYLDTYNPTGTYQGSSTLTPVRLSNPDFAWETNKKFETTLELGFLQDRILFVASYYCNRSSNQLVGFPLPPTAGFTNITGNFPATVQNTGLEFELNTVNFQRDAFQWRSSLNISIPKNKLIAFPDLATSPSYANTYVVGEPLGIRKLFHFIGLNTATGLYEFKDENQDGVFNVSDMKTAKYVGQEYAAGLQNAFQYRNFQFDLLFQFVKQTGNNYLVTGFAPGLLGNQPAFVMDRWQKPGDHASIQRFSAATAALTAYSRLRTSDASVTDASYIRLKNLSVSYSIPKKWIGKIKLDDARLFIQGQNLFTITDYKGLDPETQGFSLPSLRVLTGGVRLTL